MAAALVALGAVLTTSTCGYRDACDQVEGQSFRSVTPGECGLTPTGVATCPWTISFRDERFSWSYSDVQESGPYSCDDELIVGHPGLGDQAYEGRFDEDREILIWQDREYRRQ